MKNKQLRNTIQVFIVGFLIMTTSIVNIYAKISDNITINGTIISHTATADEINEIKKQCGVFDYNKNYNIMYGEFGTGLSPPTEEEWNQLVGFLLIDDITPPQSLSSSVDLSNSPYFPQVRSQGTQGSCAAWATTYYANGYVQARNNNWNQANNGYNYHLLSPAFTFNKCCIVYEPNDVGGSSTFHNAAVMQTVGVCRWSQMPYIDVNYRDWGNESAWRDAPSYRIKNIHSLLKSNIAGIKTILNNDYPVTFGLNASSYSNFDSDNVLGSTAMLIHWNHANTIVGYDDNKVDAETGEIGAFKCVNSWGSGWGPNHNGFYWITYSAFIGSWNTHSIYWYEELYQDQTPHLLATWRFNQQGDRRAAIHVGIGSFSSPLEVRVPNWLPFLYNENNPFPAFMCLDITEFLSGWIDTNEFFLYIGNGITPSEIDTFQIEFNQFNYIPGLPEEISSNSPDTPFTSPGHGSVTFEPPLSPSDSEVILTTEAPLVTCPQRDGPALESLQISLKDVNGCPIRNVPATSFSFFITKNSNTLSYGSPSCTFVPLAVQTNAQGIISFRIIGDTSMSGKIYIRVVVNSANLDDVPKLSCVSFDINCDGAVNICDTSLFAGDYYIDYNTRSDFTGDGVINLADISLFAPHIGHHY